MERETDVAMQVHIPGQLMFMRIEEIVMRDFGCFFCQYVKLKEKGGHGRMSYHGRWSPVVNCFICKVGQPWLHKLSYESTLIVQSNQKRMSNYNIVFLPSLAFPTLYYLTIPSNTAIDPLPETQINLSALELPPPRTANSLELSEQELLAAGYERKKRVWTAEEDQMLLELVGTQNIPWKQIQQHMPQRTEKMCYSRYRRLLAEARQRWAPEDERRLKELVETQGESWKVYAPLFPNRTWKQLRDKYVNYLRPDINREEWSLQEDQKILELIGKYGTKWKSIQQQMGSRTDNQIKNRYYGRLKLLLKRKARRRSQLSS